MAANHYQVCAYSRRRFLQAGALLAASAPFNLSWAETLNDATRKAKVALARCRNYGADVKPALRQCFDLLGGIGGLVRGKSATVKLNLTGTDFTPYLGCPVGETFMTHSDTVMALLSLLFEAGATRARLVESTQSRDDLKTTLGIAGWNVNALTALGKVEYENTRNLGDGQAYATLRVPFGGYMFSSLNLNHAYHETDVMISLAKLKQHVTAGVTLSMKNMFGATPNALYGAEAGDERATAGRNPLHDPSGFDKLKLPGLKSGPLPRDGFSRVPRIVVDICSARPVDLAIIDGITAMNGGEGPWCAQAVAIRRTTPGVLIAGLNPVSTDAVATAVMGYDPRAPRGTHPFNYAENTLLLAEKAGVGSADLSRIDVRGLTLDTARYPYG